MDIKQIKKVMKKYGEAWEKKDSKLILECFTKKSIYQEGPLAKPYKGHKEIKKFWDNEVVKNTKKIKFKLGKCYVSKEGKTGFVEWESINYHKWKNNRRKWVKGHMRGIMILKMKKDKITYLNEYWNTSTA